MNYTLKVCSNEPPPGYFHDAEPFVRIVIENQMTRDNGIAQILQMGSKSGIS